MKKTTYSCSTLDKCIGKACKDLGIQESELNYEILEEKQGFFTKKTTILVSIVEENQEEEKKDKKEDEIGKEQNKQDNSNIKDDENNGKIKVLNNEIIIKNPKDEGKPAVICPGKNIIILVDGEQIKSQTSVFEENKIEVIFEESKSERNLDIQTSNDYMEAHISIKYKPEIKYGLKDKEAKNYLILDGEIVEETNPPYYTQDEIKGALKKMGIVYGIIEENLEKCTKNSSIEIIIAKGKETIDEEDDRIDIRFSKDTDEVKLIEDEIGNVDFKSIGSIESVKPGDVLAVRTKGKPGEDGKNIKGMVQKHKSGTKLLLKPGQGAVLKDENTIEAAIEGKPCVKSNVFYVYQVHEVRGDVDLKTGNIKFIGDVVVQGSVKEGMKVEAGNSVEIKKDVERSEIMSKGNLKIDGTIINSNIYGGGQDTTKMKILDNLEKLENILVHLTSAVEEIKRFNLLGQGKKDGEVIKVLIESKFKSLTKICVTIMTNIKMCRDDDKEDEIVEIIRKKLIGMGPINIKHYRELDQIIKVVREKQEKCREFLSIPVNVNISYCQESNIESTGDIYVKGKGQYISKLISNNGIYFTNEKSVARGGHLIAKNEIRCKEVGSVAGVITKLQVGKEGNIYVGVAYQNTMFIIGDKEYLLENASKEIHAYLNNKDEIFVDKFIL